MNAVRSGKFSSDRTIREYAEKIWGLEECKVLPDIDDEGNMKKDDGHKKKDDGHHAKKEEDHHAKKDNDLVKKTDDHAKKDNDLVKKNDTKEETASKK